LTAVIGAMLAGSGSIIRFSTWCIILSGDRPGQIQQMRPAIPSRHRRSAARAWVTLSLFHRDRFRVGSRVARFLRAGSLGLAGRSSERFFSCRRSWFIGTDSRPTPWRAATTRVGCRFAMVVGSSGAHALAWRYPPPCSCRRWMARGGRSRSAAGNGPDVLHRAESTVDAEAISPGHGGVTTR